MIIDNTPLELHHVGSVPILVKREDLCAPYPGPMFSKMRGVVAHIRNRPETTIGVLDTLHSKAGWCVSYVCQQLGKQAVNYWPRYKADPKEVPHPRQQQREAFSLGAKMVTLKAGRSAILYHTAKKHLKEHFPDSYLMPNALKLQESITENAAEALRTSQELYAGTSTPVLPEAATLVISISSGTVASGVLQGLASAGLLDKWDVVFHMGYSRSIDAARAYMEKASGLDLGAYRFRFLDEGFGYADQVKWDGRECIAPSFPCNPYYDGKAWAWLQRNANAERLAESGKPIVFWNIGA